MNEIKKRAQSDRRREFQADDLDKCSQHAGDETAVRADVTEAMRTSGAIPPWRTIIMPAQKPLVPLIRADGPGSAYVSCEESTGYTDERRWWFCYLSMSGGHQIPRVEGEPYPLRATVDFAIERCEQMLTWLRGLRAQTPET